MPSKREVVPDCGTQERVPEQSKLNPAAAGLANSVNDEFAGVAKST
jgi:hypothetical protein